MDPWFRPVSADQPSGDEGHWGSMGDPASKAAQRARYGGEHVGIEQIRMISYRS